MDVVPSSGLLLAEKRPKLEQHCKVWFGFSVEEVQQASFLKRNTASGIEDVDVLVADVADLGSLEAMCARCTVIINCVGPVSATCMVQTV